MQDFFDRDRIKFSNYHTEISKYSHCGENGSDFIFI